MKIGIFGGAFNPVHKGHIQLAQNYFHKLSLDKLLFVPVCSGYLLYDFQKLDVNLGGLEHFLVHLAGNTHGVGGRHGLAPKKLVVNIHNNLSGRVAEHVFVVAAGQSFHDIAGKHHRRFVPGLERLGHGIVLRSAGGPLKAAVGG